MLPDRLARVVQLLARLPGVLFGVEFEELIGEKFVLVLPLNFLGRGRVNLGAQYMDAFAHLGDERFDALQDSGGGAVAFFESGDTGDLLRGVLGSEIATPNEAHRRGCQLSLRVKGPRDAGRSLFDHLNANGIVVDWREPDVIRAHITLLAEKANDGECGH